MPTWLGVDVGGTRKAFDVAVVDDRRLIALQGGLDVASVLGLVAEHDPAVVAIDSPRCFAPNGRKTREGERMLNREVCGIRWTPDEAHAVGPYYEWIHAGMRLYEALAHETGADVIEVFPTASWTRWLGPRKGVRRSVWTTRGLTRLQVEAVPHRTNQDQRDAIAAAITAREHTAGLTGAFGEILVPRGKPAADAQGSGPATEPGWRLDELAYAGRENLDAEHVLNKNPCNPA